MKSIILSLILFLPVFCFSYEDVLQGRPSIYGSSKNVNCPIEVVPGKGIGPLEVGRHLKEFEDLKMTMKSVQGSKTHMIIGRYSVQFSEQGILKYVEAEIGDLPDCVYFGRTKITKKMSSAQIAEILPNCKKLEIRYGGNIIECEGISIGSGGWGGTQKTPSLRVMIK